MRVYEEPIMDVLRIIDIITDEMSKPHGGDSSEEL